MYINSDFPGVVDNWDGYERHIFSVSGFQAFLVKPRCPAAPGKPWVWRARFFGFYPYVDLALLEKGFHLAYIDVVGLFGSPESRWRFSLFHDFIVNQIGLNPKAVMEAYDRGGLPLYNWASQHPEKVACIYCDSPVCDFKSWPGGKGKSPGSPSDWEQCLRAYGLTEAEAMEFKGNPIDNLEPLAKAGVPLIHVSGDNDEIVPFEENTMVVAERYSKLGGHVKVIVKPGCKHHPHCLENPEEIVDFILAAVARS